MLRVSFTLFNLQGTHSTAFQLSVRYILAHSFSLVKHFFQKFFASYSAALSFKLVRSRRGTRLFYHTLSSLSRTFFKFFRGFQPRITRFQSFSTTSALPSELIHFTTRFPLCQALFFKSGSKSVQLPLGFFSLFDSFQCPLVRRSDRIPPHTAFVNTFFHFFFPFFVLLGCPLFFAAKQTQNIPLCYQRGMFQITISNSL